MLFAPGGCNQDSPSGAAGADSDGPVDAAAIGSSDGAKTSDLAVSSSAPSDPNADGPYAIAEIDDTYKVPATGDMVAIHSAYPRSGPTPGPYPVIVVGHGFQLPPSQYYGYVRRLASFGYVALTVDFPASFLGLSNVKEAQDFAAGIDWALGRAETRAISDGTRAGATGHSLGGKVALLAALRDPRFQATITLDPVNSSVNCSAADCPDVASMLGSLHVPSGFVGETLDGNGGLMPCAPAAANYTVFYSHSGSPSLEVTVNGANHMSFLDDVGSCGLTCGFCNKATLANADVNGLARSFVVAFYERYLRGDTRYDAYLNGAIAQARYVTPGTATIASK